MKNWQEEAENNQPTWDDCKAFTKNTLREEAVSFIHNITAHIQPESRRDASREKIIGQMRNVKNRLKKVFTSSV